MTRRIAGLAALVTGLLLGAAGCTSSSGHPNASATPRTSISPSSLATTAIPTTQPATPTTSPQGNAALTAYLAYIAATYLAERSPSKSHTRQLSAHAVDPALGTIEGLLTQLQIAGIANRGTPPKSRVKIIKVDPLATPWPTVTLLDCPTVASSSEAYYIKSGRPVEVLPNKNKPPYAVTATVIQYKGRWVVYKTIADRTHTCAP
jgi:hypothetical protein